MSAIWGFVDLNPECIIGDSFMADKASDMKDAYEKCAIDKFSEEFFCRGFFACGMQFFSSRNENEKLPIYDVENGYLFTADIVLHGRKKLIFELEQCGDILERMPSVRKCTGIDFGEDKNKLQEELYKTPDGALSYLAWLVWGEKFIDHIIGLFAIAIYDMKKNKFYLYADHMGTRCINYYCCDGKIYFSTLTKAITNIMSEDAVSYNDRFIAAAEATSSPELCLFPGDTPYQNIYQVCRGTCISVETSGEGMVCLEENEYWNPNSIKKSEYGKDVDYRNLFRQTFFDCIEDAIDTDKNIASTISSGLDSTSVAGVAAIKLAKQDRKLYGFTQVPLREYVSSYDENVVTDETRGVQKVLDRYDNIEHCFDDYEGKSVFTEVDRIVKMAEVPVKAMVNAIWVDDILSKARAKDCRVLLIGQFGNGTISRGNILTRVYQECRKGKILEAKKQLARFGARYGVTRKTMLSAVVNEFFDKAFFDIGLNFAYNASFDAKYLKSDLLKQYRIKQLSRREAKKTGFNFDVTSRQQNSFILSKNVAQAISIYDTKFSLYHGVIIKDPTRDKRLVELITHLPDSEFCDEGLERRLVREYLDDIVPNEIRLDPVHRGRQGADAILRMQKYGYEKMKSSFSEGLWDYCNKGNVTKLFRSGDITEENMCDIARILALNSFLG